MWPGFVKRFYWPARKNMGGEGRSFSSNTLGGRAAHPLTDFLTQDSSAKSSSSRRSATATSQPSISVIFQITSIGSCTAQRDAQRIRVRQELLSRSALAACFIQSGLRPQLLKLRLVAQKNEPSSVVVDSAVLHFQNVQSLFLIADGGIGACEAAGSTSERRTSISARRAARWRSMPRSGTLSKP